MCMCDVEDVINMYSGLDGWDEVWVWLGHVLGGIM